MALIPAASARQLTTEYNDLESELYYCGRRDERQRCARRMNEIISLLRPASDVPQQRVVMGQ